MPVRHRRDLVLAPIIHQHIRLMKNFVLKACRKMEKNKRGLCLLESLCLKIWMKPLGNIDCNNNNRTRWRIKRKKKPKYPKLYSSSPRESLAGYSSWGAAVPHYYRVRAITGNCCCNFVDTWGEFSQTERKKKKQQSHKHIVKTNGKKANSEQQQKKVAFPALASWVNWC